jgi:hypothetical protein
MVFCNVYICTRLFVTVIVLVKQAAFIPPFSQTVYGHLNRYICLPILTDLTRIKLL